MAFSERFLEELRSKNDIESVVSRYVQLKKSSSNLVGLCPFHSEKTPSFTIYQDTQSYFCFGCQNGGDVITFIRNIENLDYVDAVRYLCEQSGVAFPENEDEDKRQAQLRKRILQMNKEAALFYHKQLYEPEGKKALEYAKVKRKLTDATIKHFGLGYSKDDWSSLTKHLESLGYSKDEMVAAGLSSKSEKGTYYDRFRGRFMFPIIDVRGNVIAFGGRRLDDDQGNPNKYLNTSDTLVFKKTYNLYALNFAKNINKGRLILCEGYMDVIAMHQAGFEEAVATLGTAITKEQARLMARYTKEVVIAYDSDNAGQNATNKAIDLLNEAGVNVRVLKIQQGKDPDEYIREFGKESFSKLIDGSGGYFDYILDKIRAKYDISLSDEKIAYLNESAKSIADIKSAIERDVYIAALAKETNVEKEAIKAEIKKQIKLKEKNFYKKEIKDHNNTKNGFKDLINPDKRDNLKASMAEEGIIGVILSDPIKTEYITQQIKSEDFVTEFNQRVYEYLINRIKNGQAIEPYIISQDFSPKEMSRILSCKAKIPSKVITKKEIDDYIDILLSAKTNKNLDSEENIREYLEFLKQKKKGS